MLPVSALILSVTPDCPLLLVLVEAWPYSKDKVFNCLTFLLLVALLANTNICKKKLQNDGKPGVWVLI